MRWPGFLNILGLREHDQATPYGFLSYVRFWGSQSSQEKSLSGWLGLFGGTSKAASGSPFCLECIRTSPLYLLMLSAFGVVVSVLDIIETHRRFLPACDWRCLVPETNTTILRDGKFVSSGLYIIVYICLFVGALRSLPDLLVPYLAVQLISIVLASMNVLIALKRRRTIRRVMLGQLLFMVVNWLQCHCHHNAIVSKNQTQCHPCSTRHDFTSPRNMKHIRDLVDIVLLVCGTFTILSITQKICNLPGADESCSRRATTIVSGRTKLDAALTASESLLTIGIKKAKYYADYYPFLWEILLVDLPHKRRAVGLFALDAVITSSCYLPIKLTRRILEWKSLRMPRPLLRTIIMKMAGEWAMNILLAAGIGAIVVAVTDEAGENKPKFAAICFGSRVLGGILIYILSRNSRQSPSLHDASCPGTFAPLAAYAMQSALFSEVTNMAAHSDYPAQTNFFQFHQRRAFALSPQHHQCTVCHHNPPHLTASGFQISGALAVIRLFAKGYMDYLSYGSEDVSKFFGFEAEPPHPVVPVFLVRYFIGGLIDNGFDIIENVLQTIVWKIEGRSSTPPRPDHRFGYRVSRPL